MKTFRMESDNLSWLNWFRSHIDDPKWLINEKKDFNSNQCAISVAISFFAAEHSLYYRLFVNPCMQQKLKSNVYVRLCIKIKEKHRQNHALLLHTHTLFFGLIFWTNKNTGHFNKILYTTICNSHFINIFMIVIVVVDDFMVITEIINPCACMDQQHQH